jgi:hypothetical protein
MTLREILTEDIIERYDVEYYDESLAKSGASQEELTADIEARYDNQEYWDDRIVFSFLDCADSISEEDMALVLSLVHPEEVIRFLVNAKCSK